MDRQALFALDVNTQPFFLVDACEEALSPSYTPFLDHAQLHEDQETSRSTSCRRGDKNATDENTPAFTASSYRSGSEKQKATDSVSISQSRGETSDDRPEPEQETQRPTSSRRLHDETSGTNGSVDTAAVAAALYSPSGPETMQSDAPLTLYPSFNRAILAHNVLTVESVTRFSYRNQIRTSYRSRIPDSPDPLIAYCLPLLALLR
jgi:hypothetical protein